MACGLAAVALFLIIGIRWTSHFPHGVFDAFWIWNAKAALLHVQHGPWQELVEGISGLGHPGYPLLLPGFISAGMDVLGSPSIGAPILAGSMFSLATVALVAGGLASIRSWPVAAIGCICLCSDPRFMKCAFSQYADIPLSLYVAGAAILLYRAVERSNRTLLILGGIYLGWAAWTKNEGQLILLAFVAAGACVFAGRNTLRATFASLALMTLGAAPAILLVATLKLSIPGGNDLLDSWSHSPEGVHVDLDRVFLVLSTMTRLIVSWSGACAIGLAAFVAASMWTMPLPPRLARAWAWPALAVAMTLVGYMMVFVVTPYDLGWHLSTALDRLFVHLWPAIVLLSLIRTDESLLVIGSAQHAGATSPPAAEVRE